MKKFSLGQSVKYVGSNSLYKDIDCYFIIKSSIMNESNKYIIENMSIGCIIVDENDIKLV